MSQPLLDIYLREIFASGGALAVPARVLYVGQSWPSGVDADVFFTDVQSAVDVAAALSPVPSAANPVDILIAPGTYAGAVALPAGGFVNLKNLSGGQGRRAPDVILSGDVTWTPSSSGTLTCRLDGIGSTDADGIVASGANLSAEIVLANCSALKTTVSGMAASALDSSLGTLALSSTAGMGMTGCAAGNVTLTGNAILSLSPGCSISGTLGVALGSIFIAHAGYIAGNITIDATSTGDIRGCEAPGTYTVAVGGTLQRSMDTQSVSSTANSTAITFTRPYATAPSAVVLQTTTDPGASTAPAQLSDAIVTSITATGFTLIDYDHNRTFAALIFQK